MSPSRRPTSNRSAPLQPPEARDFKSDALKLNLPKEVPDPVSLRKTVDGMMAQQVVVPAETDYGFEWVGRSHYLAFHDIQMLDGETHADGLPVKRLKDIRNTFTFIPSGCRVWGWTSMAKKDNSFVALYLNPEEIREEVGARLHDSVLRPEVFFKAPELLGTIGKLRRALSSEPQPDSLYIETLTVLATTEFCLLRERHRDEPQPGARLTQKTLDWIDDYIRENLAQPIALDDLAKLSGLSRFHFLRVFKQRTRETPYQRVLRMRVERAQELLSMPGRSISDVAQTVGFTSASRFIATFRKALGVTPGDFIAHLGHPRSANRRDSR